MAEFGAHLTSTGGDNQPSIFEVLAQENLMSSLRPAVKYACRILAEKKPDKLGWLYAYCDETYTVLDFIIQSYYLKTYSASFAENFYGMKRKSVEKISTNLPKQKQYLSVLYLVIVPYVKMKFDQLFEKLRQQVADGFHSSKTLMSRLCRLFVCVYPYVHMTWEGTMLTYQLMYMFGKQPWHTPFIQLAGVQLKNLTEEDLNNQNSEGTSSHVQPTSWIQWLMYIANKLLGGVAISLSTGLSVGVFFLQFLEWWYASDRSTMASVTSLPIPDPPQKIDDSSISSKSNVCPLCNKVRTNDTALSVSGFVFCYVCIYKFVKQHNCCPITSYPARTEHLVKLYSAGS